MTHNLRVFIRCLLLGLTLVACNQLPATAPSSSTGSNELPSEPPPPSAAEVEWQSSPVPVFRGDPTLGAPSAPVTIVEFGDLQCPFCVRANETLRALRDKYGPTEVRFVWKNYPLPFHKQARPAQEAAAAVHALGGDFWQFHDLAYANQQQLSSANFLAWATTAGVDPDTFRSQVGAQEYANTVDEDIALARKLSVDGTPHFFINGLRLGGARPQAEFEKLIDSQLAAASKLSAAGVPAERVSLQLTATNYKAQALPSSSPTVDKRSWKIPVLADDPVRGSTDALVTIVEWSDFQCPYCARVQKTLHNLLAAHPRDLRVVWKDSPLPFHKRAVPAAMAARFAFEKGGNEAFWALHDQLFARQEDLSDATLEALLTERKLSWSEAQAAFAGKKITSKLRNSLETAEDFKARGTPHFFINGRRLVGAQPIEAFEAIVQEQLEAAQALVASGVSRAQIYEQLLKDALPAAQPEKRTVPGPGPEHAAKGPPSAKIVIQEFSDFQCPFCRRVNPTLTQLLKAYPKDIRVVWRHLPLAFHEHAQLAAEAAQEAFSQGGNAAFWKFHDLLFAHQDALSRPELDQYARDIGLDPERFALALDQHVHLAQIQKDIAVARAAQLNGTPAFVINGFLLAGAQPYSRFERLVERLLAPQE